MKSRKSFLVPIAVKLITISTIIILVTITVSTAVVSGIIRNDVRITAENNNLSLNQHAASEAEIFINSIITNTGLILNLGEFGENSENSAKSKKQNDIFDSMPNIAAIVVPSFAKVVNQQYLQSLGLSEQDIERFIQSEQDNFERAEHGEIILLNASPFFGCSLTALLMPVEFADTQEAVLALFSCESLADTFSSGTNKVLMVNSYGDVIVSDNLTQIIDGKNIGESKIFGIISQSQSRQQQLIYTDENHKEYFASFSKLLNGELCIITQIDGEIVFEALNRALHQNQWLNISILCAAILFVWFFAKTITMPVETLKSAAQKIKQGEFDVKIDVKSHDELSLLAKSMQNMSTGLAERERLKESFGRFTNAQIAEKAAKGELKLGGEKRYISVFFADLRGFTAFSDKLQAEEIVHFLNKYLEKMVGCINKTGGNVDKFIGDAVMAVWGAPSGISPKQDALNAITAAFLMRYALIELNETLDGQHIKNGCGISSGEVIAGQIGSSERMEYTVIGDTVNLASRIEAINKQLATDILISEETFSLVKDEIIAEEMPAFFVKGKEEAIRLFAPVALKNPAGTPLQGIKQVENIEQLRKILGYQTPDLTKVDINEEEKKYKIKK